MIGPATIVQDEGELCCAGSCVSQGDRNCGQCGKDCARFESEDADVSCIYEGDGFCCGVDTILLPLCLDSLPL